MNDLFAVEAWLAQRLKSHPGVDALCSGRVYAEVADQGALLPLLVVGFAGSTDGGQVGTCEPVYAWIDVSLRAIAEGPSFLGAARLAAAAHAAISGVSGTIYVDGRGYTVKAVHRRSLLRYVETADGVRYAHQGGVYRLLVHALEL